MWKVAMRLAGKLGECPIRSQQVARSRIQDNFNKCQYRIYSELGINYSGTSSRGRGDGCSRDEPHLVAGQVAGQVTFPLGISGPAFSCCIQHT